MNNINAFSDFWLAFKTRLRGWPFKNPPVQNLLELLVYEGLLFKGPEIIVTFKPGLPGFPKCLCAFYISTGPVFKEHIIMEKCHYLIKVMLFPGKVPLL